MMLYECLDQNPDDTFKQHVYKSSYKCYKPNMPDDFKKWKGIVAACGLGGESFYFPLVNYHLPPWGTAPHSAQVPCQKRGSEFLQACPTPTSWAERSNSGI